MKTFEDLVFLPHPISVRADKLPLEMRSEYMNTRQAIVNFDNGYGVSVILGSCFYSNGIDSYEVAVLDNGNVCYDTPITDDIIARVSPEQVTEIMKKVQELDNTKNIMSTELIKIDEVTSIMGGFSEIVNKSNTSVAKCNEAGQALLDTIEGNGGLDEALDRKASEYLEKTKITIKNMGERRKPITQLFDKIRSAFTAQEKTLDPKDPITIPGKITKLRDQYAQVKYEAEQKRKQEAERLAKVNSEKATYKRDLEEKLLNHFNAYLRAKKAELNNMFNALTLVGFERETNMILLSSTDYPKAHFDAFYDDVQTYYISADTKVELRMEVLSWKYENLAAQFKSEMTDAKQWCKDRFVSKKSELQEIEELRKSDAAAAAEAEKLKLQREQEEAAKLAQDAAAKEEMQRKKLDAAAQQEQMTGLFDQSEATIAPAPTNARVKEKIQVLHPAGFLAVFNMWWLEEGQSLPMDELEKVFKKQITYCEKQANGKDQKYLESNYVKYIDDVKAK